MIWTLMTCQPGCALALFPFCPLVSGFSGGFFLAVGTGKGKKCVMSCFEGLFGFWCRSLEGGGGLFASVSGWTVGQGLVFVV